MKLTKFGHCCLLIEEKGIRIITDPGNYTIAQSEVKGIDVILITHEHADHFHVPSLKDCLKNNPQAKVFTNRGVAKLLDAEGIGYTLLEHGQHEKFKNVLIEGYGEKHAIIYGSYGQVINTGFFINGKLFYPGDAFYDPKKPVEILALPIAGTWMKVGEAIDYALKIRPKRCFPVHDGLITPKVLAHKPAAQFLSEKGIDFFIPEEGKAVEL